MTRVCLLGSPDLDLRYELLSRETSREALSTYDLERPFENALAVRTVSVGAAVALLNDLQWYIVRFVDETLVQDPSVSDDEWLSRSLAEALRNGEVDPDGTGEYLKVYGIERGTESADGVDADEPNPDAEGDGEAADDEPTGKESAEPGPVGPTADRLVEPLYVRRADGEVPEYDLRDVDDTLVVRLTEEEFSP